MGDGKKILHERVQGKGHPAKKISPCGRQSKIGGKVRPPIVKYSTSEQSYASPVHGKARVGARR